LLTSALRALVKELKGEDIIGNHMGVHLKIIGSAF